jgi:hypothetical protein
MRDDIKMNIMSDPRQHAVEEGLGPNSDIGAKLRALYGAVQNEGIPEHLLDLLERLDEAEKRADGATTPEGE